MTCDEYFDYLTSTVPTIAGELPTAHLAGCPRCRSLAETLEPALELFRTTAGEARTEHAAPGDLHDDIPAWLLAEIGPSDLDRSAKGPSLRSADAPTSSTSNSRRSLAWPVLAATLIGILTGGAVWGVSSASQRGASHRRANEWPGLSAIQLAPACLVQRDSPAASLPDGGLPLSALSDTERDRLNCCTSCHALGRVAAAACDARLLAVSCQVCHSR